MRGKGDFTGQSAEELAHGIRENLEPFVHQLIQVLLVGFAIGMMRTVVPALAEEEFGVAQGSFMLLSAFVVAFGVVKGVLNFIVHTGEANGTADALTVVSRIVARLS